MKEIKRLGIALIVSGPSGSGKSSISREVMKRHPEVAFSISCTTRSPRSGERNGVDYHFLSVEEFRKKIEAGEFIEYAQVHGNFYGTLKSEVEKRIREAGLDLVQSRVPPVKIVK